MQDVCLTAHVHSANNVIAMVCYGHRRSWKGWVNEGQPKQASSMPASLSARLPEGAPSIPTLCLEGMSGTPAVSPPSTAWLLPEQPTSSTCCHDKLDNSIVGSGAAPVISQLCIAPAAAEDPVQVAARLIHAPSTGIYNFVDKRTHVPIGHAAFFSAVAKTC